MFFATMHSVFFTEYLHSLALTDAGLGLPQSRNTLSPVSDELISRNTILLNSPQLIIAEYHYLTDLLLPMI